MRDALRPRWDVLLWYWLPEDTAAERATRDRVPYPDWIRRKFIEATPGNVTDYAFIRRRVKEVIQDYSLQEIGFDPWNASQLAIELAEQDGIPMVEVRQGILTLNEPTKRLGMLVANRDLRHGGNPVLRWNAANVAIRSDSEGNIKPDKEHSTEKIDGVVALIMALSRAIVSKGTGSVYDTRGLTVL